MSKRDQQPLILYHSGTSVCSQKVRLVLAELNLDWTGHLLDLATGDQFDPDYRKLNPAAVVPTLVAGDRFSLADAAIIPFLHRLGMLGLSGYWQNKPAIANWMARSARRPSFSIAIDAFITPPVKQKYREAIINAGTALTGQLGP